MVQVVVTKPVVCVNTEVTTFTETEIEIKLLNKVLNAGNEVIGPKRKENSRLRVTQFNLLSS